MFTAVCCVKQPCHLRNWTAHTLKCGMDFFTQELEGMRRRGRPRKRWKEEVEWIKGQRISWLGHLERMEEDRMPKKIFTQELEGTRRKGRLRKRWKEEAEWIKGQRISWLGNLQRMEEYRMPKKIFTEELEGTRRKGRLRKRWKEEAERDLPVLGVRRWRELVADREKWKDIVRQAKAHSGL